MNKLGVATVGLLLFGVSGCGLFQRNRHVEENATASERHPLGGFWKAETCDDAWGLAIGPMGEDTYYVSFCGPGGCFPEGAYRPETRIVGDAAYRVLDPDTIEVKGRDGWTRYVRCEGREPRQPAACGASETSAHEAHRLAQLDEASADGAAWSRSLDNQWLSQAIGSPSKTCHDSAPEGGDERFTVYLRLSKSGAVTDAVSYPATPYSCCFAAEMRTVAFPRAPREGFWFLVVMAMDEVPSAAEQQNAAGTPQDR